MEYTYEANLSQYVLNVESVFWMWKESGSPCKQGEENGDMSGEISAY